MLAYLTGGLVLAIAINRGFVLNDVVALCVYTVIIGGLLAAIVLAAYFTQASKTLLFWMAFVLTRPFGATMGDVLTKPQERGGLGFGTVGSSAILGAILVILVVYTTLKNAPTATAADHP